MYRHILASLRRQNPRWSLLPAEFCDTKITELQLGMWLTGEKKVCVGRGTATATTGKCGWGSKPCYVWCWGGGSASTNRDATEMQLDGGAAPTYTQPVQMISSLLVSEWNIRTPQVSMGQAIHTGSPPPKQKSNLIYYYSSKPLT